MPAGIEASSHAPATQNQGDGVLGTRAESHMAASSANTAIDTAVATANTVRVRVGGRPNHG